MFFKVVSMLIKERLMKFVIQQNFGKKGKSIKQTCEIIAQIDE